MRACFLGQNVCALGYGVAIVQTPRLEEPVLGPASGTAAPEEAPAAGTLPQAQTVPLNESALTDLMFKDLRRRGVLASA